MRLTLKPGRSASHKWERMLGASRHLAFQEHTAEAIVRYVNLRASRTARKNGMRKFQRNRRNLPGTCHDPPQAHAHGWPQWERKVGASRHQAIQEQTAEAIMHYANLGIPATDRYTPQAWAHRQPQVRGKGGSFFKTPGHTRTHCRSNSALCQPRHQETSWKRMTEYLLGSLLPKSVSAQTFLATRAETSCGETLWERACLRHKGLLNKRQGSSK